MMMMTDLYRAKE